MREPEFIGGEVDLRINIYRGKSVTNNAIINANGVGYGADDTANGVKTPLKKEQGQIEKLLQLIEKNLSATQAYYAEKIGVSKRTVSRIIENAEIQFLFRRMAGFHSELPPWERFDGLRPCYRWCCQ